MLTLAKHLEEIIDRKKGFRIIWEQCEHDNKIRNVWEQKRQNNKWIKWTKNNENRYKKTKRSIITINESKGKGKNGKI